MRTLTEAPTPQTLTEIEGDHIVLPVGDFCHPLTKHRMRATKSDLSRLLRQHEECSPPYRISVDVEGVVGRPVGFGALFVDGEETGLYVRQIMLRPPGVYALKTYRYLSPLVQLLPTSGDVIKLIGVSLAKEPQDWEAQRVRV